MPERSHNYFKWYHGSVAGAASMGALKDTPLKVTRAINGGQSAVGIISPTAYFQMRDTHPKDVMLIDQLSTTSGFQLVGPRVQAFLRGEALPGLELPQVSIRDHRGKTVATDYAIVHSTRIVDCIDQKLSDFEWNSLAPDTMAPISTMVLDATTLGPEDRLIRPRYVMSTLLVRDDLAERIMEQMFIGPAMVPI